MGNEQKLEEFKVHDRKNLDCLEQTVDKNMNVKDFSSDDSERSEKHSSEREYEIVLSRMLVEILNVPLVKAEKNMRNASLEIGGQVNFVIQWQKV